MSIGKKKDNKKPTIANVYHHIQSRNLCLRDNPTDIKGDAEIQVSVFTGYELT